MRASILLTSIFFVLGLHSQNNVHIFNGSGKAFRVLQNEKYITSTPQTDVVLYKIKEDTLRLKLEFGERRYGATFYLLNKGKHISQREFTYRVEPVKDKLEIVYMGMDSVSFRERKLVPDAQAPTPKK